MKMKTTLPTYAHRPDFDADKGPFHEPGTPVWWTGEAPPPMVGRTVVVLANTMGPAVVKGYFDEGDFLAIGVCYLKPPAWYLAQGSTLTTVSRIYGAELASREELALRRRALAAESREKGMLSGAYMVELLERGLFLPLWSSPGGRWIGEGEDGQLYAFPARQAGWDERVLVPSATGFPSEDMDARAQRPILAIATGWPGAPGLDPLLPLP